MSYGTTIAMDVTANVGGRTPFPTAIASAERVCPGFLPI